MEEVEITMTLETMVGSSQTMGQWREITLVAETQVVDPMVVSILYKSEQHQTSK